MRLKAACSVSQVIMIPKDPESELQDGVWPEGEGHKVDRGVMGDLDQLWEREHDCTNTLPRAVKTGSLYFADIGIIFIIANMY